MAYRTGGPSWDNATKGGRQYPAEVIMNAADGAHAATVADASMADLLIQWAKRPGTAVPQLQDIARSLHGTPGLLARRL